MERKDFKKSKQIKFIVKKIESFFKKKGYNTAILTSKSTNTSYLEISDNYFRKKIKVRFSDHDSLQDFTPEEIKERRLEEIELDFDIDVNESNIEKYIKEINNLIEEKEFEKNNNIVEKKNLESKKQLNKFVKYLDFLGLKRLGFEGHIKIEEGKIKSSYYINKTVNAVVCTDKIKFASYKKCENHGEGFIYYF
jgi:formate dehydrogenase maturation protein FdhE